MAISQHLVVSTREPGEPGEPGEPLLDPVRLFQRIQLDLKGEEAFA